MSIDQATFLTEMTKICRWFRIDGKEFAENNMEFYFTYLNERLSTEEFLKACHVVKAEEWKLPPPAHFVTKAGKDPAIQASAEWDLIIKQMRSGSHRAPEGLSHAGKQALEKFNGVRGIADTPETYLNGRRREFIEAFQSIAVNNPQSLVKLPQLPPVQPKKELPPQNWTEADAEVVRAKSEAFREKLLRSKDLQPAKVEPFTIDMRAKFLARCQKAKQEIASGDPVWIEEARRFIVNSPHTRAVYDQKTGRLIDFEVVSEPD